MDDKFGLGVVASAVFLFFAILVWMFTHASIGEECEKQGSFYVGKTVYECKLKEKK